MKRVVLIGDEYGLKTLCESVIENNDFKIVGVVCHKGRKAAEKEAAEICKVFNCTLFLQASRMDAEDYNCFVKEIKATKAEFALCFSYDVILKKEILESFPRGIFNVHVALLPKYRGGNVLNWVLINGEKETGVTLHQMEEAVDSGPIVLQKKVLIDFEDTALSLRDKLNNVSIELLGEFWRLAAENKIEAVPQDEEKVSVVLKRRPEDGLFEWDWDAMRIYNKIRALIKPWPGAFYMENGEKVVIDHFMSYEEVVKMKEEKEKMGNG